MKTKTRVWLETEALSRNLWRSSPNTKFAHHSRLNDDLDGTIFKLGFWMLIEYVLSIFLIHCVIRKHWYGWSLQSTQSSLLAPNLLSPKKKTHSFYTFTKILYPSVVSDINECESSDGDPCENGGTCENTYGSFWCACPSGFVGKSCERGKSRSAIFFLK